MMAAFNASSNNLHEAQMTEFESRRAELVGQIGDSLEQVLTQINALNRSLESVIEIGNEFASVEALWSQFEAVMGANQDVDAGAPGGGSEQEEQQQQRQHQNPQKQNDADQNKGAGESGRKEG